MKSILLCLLYRREYCFIHEFFVFTYHLLDEHFVCVQASFSHSFAKTQRLPRLHPTLSVRGDASLECGLELLAASSCIGTWCRLVSVPPGSWLNFGPLRYGPEESEKLVEPSHKQNHSQKIQKNTKKYKKNTQKYKNTKIQKKYKNTKRNTQKYKIQKQIQTKNKKKHKGMMRKSVKDTTN